MVALTGQGLCQVKSEWDLRLNRWGYVGGLWLDMRSPLTSPLPYPRPPLLPG